MGIQVGNNTIHTVLYAASRYEIYAKQTHRKIQQYIIKEGKGQNIEIENNTV